MKKFHNLNAIIIAIVVVIADQLSKFFIDKGLIIGQSIALIKNVLHITLVYNQGAGFGILQGGKLFFIVFSLVVLVLLAINWKKIPSEKNSSIPLGLILGGMVGNLIDRFYLGYVIDFIDFRVWPVFNAADSAITIGVVWLIIYLWKK